MSTHQSPENGSPSKRLVRATRELIQEATQLLKRKGKRLAADVVNFSKVNSSLSKSESILDTARTLDAMDPDAVVVRHGVAGVPKRIADVLDAPVINAGVIMANIAWNIMKA